MKNEKVPYTIISKNVDGDIHKGIIYLKPNLNKEQLEKVVERRYFSRSAQRRGVDNSGFVSIVIKPRNNRYVSITQEEDASEDASSYENELMPDTSNYEGEWQPYRSNNRY